MKSLSSVVRGTWMNPIQNGDYWINGFAWGAAVIGILWWMWSL